MVKKSSVLANFNCTFGKENRPMLEYFKDIVYPAFKSGIIREVGEDKYFFESATVKSTSKNRHILTGIIVKKTKLEVKTEHDDVNGITFTHKLYDSAPISIFTIFLDNHRMIYTTNQKGSPDIRSFAATVKHILKEYIRNYNEEQPKDKKVPYPVIDIVNIPSEKDIKEKLRMVKRIEKLTFKLFNPNGDFHITPTYEKLLEQLEFVGSKKGNVTMNSPSNFGNVAKLITGTKGMAEAQMKVKYISGGKGTIDHNSMGEKITIEFPEDSSVGSVATIVIDTLIERDELKIVSEENREIYKKNLPDIFSI